MEKELEKQNLKEFLEKTPPGVNVIIPSFLWQESQFTSAYIQIPELNLYCKNEHCKGIRYFTSVVSDSDYSLAAEQIENSNFLHYQCKNCRKEKKIFSLYSITQDGGKTWIVKKYGEHPQFGSPTPGRVTTLIGAEKELFLKGRRCENQGLGIGASVYYRRVIESQKNRIFDEILKVVNKISSGNKVISEIETAKNEVQFTTAIEKIKHALPDSLKINGYDPLKLLHSALSEGVHLHTDEECLQQAEDIRIVLFEFAERLAEALKDEAALNGAVSRLANKNKK